MEYRALIEGFVDVFTLWGASGWAWLPGDPEHAVEVQAVWNGTVVGRTIAKQFRPDLKKKGIGTGEHGFSLVFDKNIEGMTQLELLARSQDEKVLLPSPPLTRIEGFVELLTSQMASGWVWRPGSPQETVLVEAVIDDRVVGRAASDKMRSDLVATGRGTGRYGFIVYFEAHVEQYENVRIRVRDSLGTVTLPGATVPAESDADVSGGEKTTPAKAGNVTAVGTTETAGGAKVSDFCLKLEGSVEALTRWGIRGWAHLQSNSGHPVELEVVVDGRVIGRGIANQIRDVPNESRKTRVGFDIEFDEPLVGKAKPSLRLASTINRVETPLPAFSANELDKIADTVQKTASRSRRIEYLSKAVQVASSQDDPVSPNIRIYPGKRTERAGRPNVLLLSHFVGEYAFGSERSFIDMIEALDALDVNLIVLLPRNVPDYTNLVRQKSRKVLIVRYGWWRDGVPVDHSVVAKFKQVLLTENIATVHINTIMPRECAIAARDCGVSTIVHVRELLTNDAQLCALIGHSASDIIEEVRDRADWIIGNSKATANAFWKKDRTFIIPNTIDVAAFSTIQRHERTKLRVGLISSNIEKKGVNDFAELARLAAQEALQAEFLLIGPITDTIKKLQAQQLTDPELRLLVFAGYAQSPTDAVAQVDVVVNFSHFTESFGRTVLEAMAAHRPVIAYAWGALSELVHHGDNGYLIPYRTPEAALPHVREMCKNRHLVATLGERGHLFSRKYDIESYKEQFAKAYARILPDGDRQTAISAPTVMRARAWPVEADRPHKPLRLAYFCWHFPVPSETFVLNELEELKRRGVDVIVFCRQSPHKTFTPKFEIEFHQIKSVEDLAESLIRTKRNMVHAHFVFPTVTNMVWPACEKTGVPFTFIAHAQDIFVYKNKAQCRLDEIGASKYCLRLFTLSQFHYDYVVSMGFPREKLVINPNAVAVLECPDASVAGTSRRGLSRKVIAIHRFVEKKGVHLLIKAASILTDLGLTFEIYGYGDYEEEYRKIISELKLTNVEIKGALPNDQIASVLKTADLFASPCVRTATGDMDGIPTSVVESMVVGVPVLTTAIAGIPDLVTDEITGIVCEPNAASIASAVRRFYSMDTLKRRLIVENAQKKAQTQHDRVRTVEVLLRVWRDQGVDVVVVSWNNLNELKLAIDRILSNTALPLHLIVCDNNSQIEPVQEFLQQVWRQDDRVTVVFNTVNAMVGPGTNLAAAQGINETIIYVCGKEGVSFRNGWELPFARALDADPKVGLVGTVGYSPNYLTGSQYPKGIRLFEQFRNKDFALNNPDRIFGHVQGGIFAMRRSMFNKIGGFSETVPHDYTDVEYSYYAESQGWKFAEPEGVLALFNKTRPSLSQRFDENVLVAHPVLPEQLEKFEALRLGHIRHCNICDWFGDAFSADGHCPECLSSAQDRTLFRWLSESPLMYRRLIALCVGLTSQMAGIAVQHFQGPKLTLTELIDELKLKQRLSARPKSASLALIRVPRLSAADLGLVAKELRRILDTGTKSIFQVDIREAQEWDDWKTELLAAMKKAGHAFEHEVRYVSRATGLDYRPLNVFRRLP